VIVSISGASGRSWSFSSTRRWWRSASSGWRRRWAICCFDTSAGMGRVAEDVVWAKLRALRDGARLASARLF
jgi:hypothetical protein